MTAKALRTLHVTTPGQWRAWLTRNHAAVAGVWLVFHKQHTGRRSILYQDALDEALCFGWVDSLIRRLDDARYARKFTPRRPDSRWSEINRRRYGFLAAAGRLQAPGRARAPTGRGYDPRPKLPTKLPAFIQAALRKNPAAGRHFRGLPPSQRRHYVAWIQTAKREETRLRRLGEAIRLLAQGRPLGLK
jgi:uncharacterized protein YdeI (YjbR/CyaY-like superfamily)